MSNFDLFLRNRLVYKTYVLLCDLYADHLIYVLLKWYYAKASLKKGVRKTIFFYPETPRKDHVIYQICRFSGFAITNSNKNADAAVFFQDTTFATVDTLVRRISRGRKVINYACRDISKRHVDEVHRSVFGYGLSIDPRTYQGSYVRKGNINSLHDGVILHSPEKPIQGYVYQRLVNNEVNGELEEIRLPVIGNSIPFVYIKHHPLMSRFDGVNTHIRMVETREALSSGECKKILQFCKTMGLDHGELDILRDTKTKKLYIVDANNTPAGPPYLLSVRAYVKALGVMAYEFKKAFL